MKFHFKIVEYNKNCHGKVELGLRATNSRSRIMLHIVIHTTHICKNMFLNTQPEIHSRNPVSTDEIGPGVGTVFNHCKGSHV